MEYKCGKPFKLCAGKNKDCDCKAILEALGNPEDCTDQSIIELLCTIAENLPIDIDLTEIIELLNQILDSLQGGGGISDSTGQTSDTGEVTYPVDEAVRITAIYASYIVGSGNPDGILIEIGTDDGVTFTSLYKLRAVQENSSGKGAVFATTLTHPLLVTPPAGEQVVVKAEIINPQGGEDVLLTVLNAI